MMFLLPFIGLINLEVATALPSWGPWYPNGNPDSCAAVSPGYDVDLVATVAQEISSHSWEFGTCAETLLELYNPGYSVFSPQAFPNDAVPFPPATIQSLAYAKPHIRLNNDTLVDGDGANGDPASLGVSAILLAQTQDTSVIANKSETYAAAVIREAQHVLSAPRMSNGAISHRDASAQAWADFIYMGPPFLAYYAVYTNNVSLLRETTRQCGLYRELLQYSHIPPETYWRHIVDQSPLNNTNRSMNDPGVWSTGNAWAAMGMTRVLATIKHWAPAAVRLTTEQTELTGWIQEIIDGARSAGVADGLLRNYLNNATWYGEISGTSMLAATTYRMAVLEPQSAFGTDPGYISWAEDLRTTVAQHVTSNGTVSPAINPLNWFDLVPFTAGSPEGQSFASQLGAAYRDWVCATQRSGGWKIW